VVEHRRARTDQDLKGLTDVVNRQLDVLFGNASGRFALHDDTGVKSAIRGGLPVTSGHPTLELRSGINFPLNIRNAANTADVLRVTDTAITMGGTLGVAGNATVGGTLGVAGAATLSSTLAVTGQTTLTGPLVANGAVTLGDAAADVISVLGTSTFAQLATFSLGISTRTIVAPATDLRISVGATEMVRIGTDGIIDYRNSQFAFLGGGAAATLGTIGGSGPGTAGQAGWTKLKIGGTVVYLPHWQ
jgi:hypothetical protein